MVLTAVTLSDFKGHSAVWNFY